MNVFHSLTWCYSVPGWATGTLPTSVLSYSDFISRPANKDSVITFEKVSSPGLLKT